MCGCEHHWDTNAPCTCSCPDHAGVRAEMASRDETPDTTGLREEGGRLVREVWIEWALEQPDPKPSWLVPWEGLSEPDREVDRRIAERLWAAHPTPDASPDPAVVTPDFGDVLALARYLYDREGFHAADSWATETSINRGRYEALAEYVLASDWLANHVAAAREADRAEVERLRALADMYLEEHDKQHARAEAAEERLADLVAKIEALIKPRLVRDSVSGLLSEVRKVHVRVRDLHPLIEAAGAATALDAVREKAKAEERERIAQAIEALPSDAPCSLSFGVAQRHAARIARHTPGDGA